MLLGWRLPVALARGPLAAPAAAEVRIDGSDDIALLRQSRPRALLVLLVDAQDLLGAAMSMSENDCGARLLDSFGNQENAGHFLIDAVVKLEPLDRVVGTLFLEGRNNLAWVGSC